MFVTHHYLLTRFNLKVSWSTDKSGVAVQTEKWLVRRLELFARYCLPSVIGQTCQDFQWLIIVDEESSPEFLTELSDLIAGHDHFKVVKTTAEKVMQDVLAIINGVDEPDQIITSRLDNDDIISRDYISRIQELACTVETDRATVIDLACGFQLSISGSTYLLLELTDHCNAFVSIVEPASNCKTVWSRNHTQWLDSSSIAIDDKDRYWIQVIHESNIINKEIMHLRAVSDFDRASFSFNAPVKLTVRRFHNLLRPWHYAIEFTKRQVRRLWQ